MNYGSIAPVPSRGKTLSKKSVYAAILAASLAVVAVVALTSAMVNDNGVVEMLTYAEKNQAFPAWAHPIEPAITDRSIVNSRWGPGIDSPPYVSKTTMYSGVGVKKGEHDSGNNVRILLKIKRSFRYHEWNTNNFISDFESPQLRFMSRGMDGYFIVPPLYSIPILSNKAVTYLNSYLIDGGNTFVVCGSASSILFLNENVPGGDLSGFELEGAYSDGPFEQQKGTAGTQFQGAATVLPGPAWGVDPKSLPANAIPLYEAPGSVAAFIVPSGRGAIIYIGWDFEADSSAWNEMLDIAAGVAKRM